MRVDETCEVIVDKNVEVMKALSTTGPARVLLLKIATTYY
jgi:hypothetical protein